MTTSEKNRRYFFLLYIGGIFLAIILGGLILVFKISSSLLLIEGICHLAILIYWGYFRIRDSPGKIYAGERIQTAGYLHTLIGFTLAICLLGTGAIEINEAEDFSDLLLPMGSALVTSIIGWSLGGEITAEESPSVEGAIRELSKSLQEQTEKLSLYTQTINNFENRQIDILSKHQQDFLDFQKRNNELLAEKINNLVTQIGQYNQSILETFQRFDSTLEDESQSLHQTFRRLNSTLEDESQSMRQIFSQLNSVIEDESQEISPAFQRLISVIEEKSEELSHSFFSLQDESQQAADFMKDTAKSTKMTADNMTTTAEAAAQAADYLNKNRVLVQQVDELLQYILQEKKKNIS
ncbi:MAG: hypothetical protein F6K41_08615 [Symploca sp. SIO3E6]|nr:hypothetical protein [Caldora sp. SIO3E6]